MKELFVMTDLAPSDDFLKSLKRGQFVLIAYSGNAICSKPEIAIITGIGLSGISVNGLREDGTKWEDFLNKEGFSHNKGDTWAKFIAPLSDTEKIIKLVNKYRRIANKEGCLDRKEIISADKFKQECFDAIAAHQTQQNQETKNEKEYR